jgi:hypothetical protein
MPQTLNLVLNIRLKLKGEYEQLRQFLNQLKIGLRLLVLEKLSPENTTHALLEQKLSIEMSFICPQKTGDSCNSETPMKYVTWFLTSIFLFQSAVSSVLTAKINQSEQQPAVTVRNPFRNLLLKNKDLTSLPNSPSNPSKSRRGNSYKKKKQVLKQKVIGVVKKYLLLVKAVFTLPRQSLSVSKLASSFCKNFPFWTCWGLKVN